MNPLYVLTPVFNPRRFASRVRLYNDFSKWTAAAGVKLLTVEIAFGERPHVVTTSDPWHMQLWSRSEIWHKERALNLALQRLTQIDPRWQYVAWMDADVKLARDDWAEEAVHLLQHYAVIQMFGEARMLGPKHEATFTCKSIGKTIASHGTTGWGGNPGVTRQSTYIRQGHPGLAWAFRRDELNDVGGWLDTCVNGSGDLHMAACYAGDWSLVTSPASSPGYRASIKQYGDLCDQHIRQNISYMPGAIDHYWHGRSTERGYDVRWRLIDKYQFSPATDLIPTVNGLWKWNIHDARVRALATETRLSLAARNEDVNEE